MSQADKAAYWRELKDAGVDFKHHYREYSTEQLAAAVARLRGEPADAAPNTTAPVPKIPEPDTVAGIRLNTVAPEEPLRVDAAGLTWWQDEVKKSAYPKPRGRRVIKYNDPGVKKITVNSKNGDSETFEMPGDDNRISEARITMPSSQVGIYSDPRYPFRVIVYNENRGFDLFEVEAFWGGQELVPTAVKRKYVAEVLCYDMRTTIREIEAEHRQLVLEGKVPA